MKKIMFNDKYGLTQAVLEGRKTQTRRVIKVQPPYEHLDIAFPVFEEECWNTNPLYGAFCWVNKNNPEEHTEWIKPQFKDGEEVAVAQSYKEAGIDFIECDVRNGHNHLWGNTKAMKGWNNKMFVLPEAMPHQIRITNVRIQRLQDISEECCLKEGIIKKWHATACKDYYYVHGVEVKSVEDVYDTAKEAFAHLINKVSGKGTWESNPYVWVYDFELIK